MEDIGHTIYSGLWGLVCVVGTICCVARKEEEGKEEEGEKGRSPGVRYI